MFDRNRSYKEYRTASRNIRVYDNDADDWAEITLEEAIQKCIIWDEAGDVADPFTTGPISRRGGAIGLSESSVEGQNDFLRFGQGNVRHEVRYVGDLDSKWLSVTQLLNAGQTLYNAVVRERADGFGLGAAVDKELTLEGLMEAAANLLGRDSLFFASADPKNSGMTREKHLAYTMANTKEIAIVPRKAARTPEAGEGPETIDSSLLEESHAKFLNEVIGDLVPDTHKGELAKIIGKKDTEWKKRASEVEALVQSCHEADPTSVPSLADSSAIKRYVNRSVLAYAKKLENRAETGASPSVRGGGGSASTTTTNIKYIPVGTPLPQGYDYLNSNEEAKAKAGKSGSGAKSCPTSLRDFHFLSEVFEGGAETQAASTGFGARRRIGRAAAQVGAATDVLGATGNDVPERPNETDEQRKERIKALRVKDRYANVDNHIARISASGAPIPIKYLAILYLGARYNRDRFMDFAAHDIYVPGGFLLMRLHAAYKTRYGIKCAAGKIGYTMIAHGNMMIEHEAARKVGFMHYTTYLSAVVTQPKNVYVVEDLFCEKYLGGLGVEFWSRELYLKKGSNRRAKSIVCTILPPTMGDMKSLGKKIDARGAW